MRLHARQWIASRSPLWRHSPTAKTATLRCDMCLLHPPSNPTTITPRHTRSCVRPEPTPTPSARRLRRWPRVSTPPPTNCSCCCTSSTNARAGTTASSRALIGCTGAPALISAPRARRCGWPRRCRPCRASARRCSAGRSPTPRCARSPAWPPPTPRRRSLIWRSPATARTSNAWCGRGAAWTACRRRRRRRRGICSASSPPGWTTTAWS